MRTRTTIAVLVILPLTGCVADPVCTWRVRGELASREPCQTPIEIELISEGRILGTGCAIPSDEGRLDARITAYNKKREESGCSRSCHRARLSEPPDLIHLQCGANETVLSKFDWRVTQRYLWLFDPMHGEIDLGKASIGSAGLDIPDAPVRR